MPVVDDTGGTDRLEENIRQSILLILETEVGERLMRPDFGARLDLVRFEPVTSVVLDAMRRRLRDALTDGEPRIDVDAVTVTPDLANGVAHVNLDYRVRATNARCSLVYQLLL